MADDISFGNDCFINTWDDEYKIQQTTYYHYIVSILLDPSKNFMVRYNNNTSGGELILITYESSHHLFKVDNNEPLGSGSFGTVRTLLYCDKYEWKDYKEWWEYDDYQTTWTDIGLAVKDFVFEQDANNEHQAVADHLNTRQCCVIQERHLVDNYFVMRKVDGDLDQFFSLYTPTLSDQSRGDYFMQKFVLQIIDRLKSLFGCIYDSGYRYFDIKLENIGYRIVNKKTGKKIELVILDIGSLEPERYDLESITGTIMTYKPPEWTSDVGLRVLYNSLLGGDTGEFIKKGYVWYMGKLLISMFVYHHEHKSFATYFRTNNGYELVTSSSSSNGGQEEDRDEYEVVKGMKQIFPPLIFPRIYTSILPYPLLRDLDLNESWITYDK